VSEDFSSSPLRRLGSLLSRDDVEDIHLEGAGPTMLRLTTGRLVAGPPIASSDEELVQLLRSIGSGDDGGLS
jgi:hypothetical protein